MAHQSLIQMTQRVWRRMPLTNVPSTVVGNSDPQVSQFLEIFQSAGEYMLKRNEWQGLNRTFSFVVATDPNFVDLPTDWPRFITRSSLWRSDSNLIPAEGPLTSDQWQYFTQLPWSGYPGYWRLADDQMQTIGISVGVTATMEYISDKWIKRVDGTYTDIFDDDTNTTVFDDDVFRLCALWMWKQSKGLAYEEDMTSFGMNLEQAIASDRSARPMSTRQFFKGSGAPYAWPGTITVSP